MILRTKTVSDGDGKSVITYNDAGQEIKVADYDAKGQAVAEVRYEYGQDGNLIGWRLYFVHGDRLQLMKRFERHYQENGMAEDRQFDARGKLESIRAADQL